MRSGHYHGDQTGLIDSLLPMTTPLDRILATLNATEVGSLDRIAEKMALAARELRGEGHEALAVKADEAVAALGRADVVEFKRLRAFIQSKVGHLR